MEKIFRRDGRLGSTARGGGRDAAKCRSSLPAETEKLPLDGCCREYDRLRRQLEWSGAANWNATVQAAWLRED
jgi:hypothetical protein